MENVNCLLCNFGDMVTGNCTAVGRVCTAVPAVHCPLLRKYLDTGLTPEQVRSMQMDMAIINAMFQYADVERMQELARADKDGRVVVLPCKDWLEVVFGDQVLFWGIDKDYVEQPIRQISLDDAERVGWYDGYKTVFLKGTDENGESWEFYPEEIGKTVFLTREDAEKALRRNENGKMG